MAKGLPNDSPAARASRELLEQVRATDCGAVAGADFDPWRCAESELRFQRAAHAPHRDQAEHRAAVEAFGLQQEARDRARAAYRGPRLRSPVQQAFAARLCLEWRADIERGDGGAVLDAVARCAAHGLTMPGWLAAAFLERWLPVANGVCRDWNEPESFGPALRKGANVAGLRLVTVYGPWAYEVAIELLVSDPGRAVDRGLYEEVGERIGRSHSQAFEAIRAHVKGGGASRPPLDYIRDRLKEGIGVDEAAKRWAVAQFEAALRSIGVEPEGRATFHEE